MTKEALIAFGLTEEQAEKAIQLHNAAMEGYVPKGTYDVLKAENENLVATVNSNKTELEKLKKFEGTNTELAAKIEKLQGEATTKETEYKEQLEKLRKINAVELALLAGENKPHDLQLVKGLIDLSLIKLDGDKVVSGLKEQVESLQKDKSFLFKPADNPGNPSGNTPRDSDTNKKEPTTSEDFGKSLAKQKLQMLGIQTEGGN